MAKTKLKYVGNFIEIGYDDDPTAPSLASARGKRTADNKQQVVDYLRSAITFIVSPGRDDDVFDPSKSAGSSSIATDGVYVWPRTLAYYVEKYDVELPPDFEAHMARNGWKPPANIERLGLELPRS